MKHLSLQWRITLLTALLIACACVCMNLLLYRTGVTGMDALNGFMMQYQPGSADPLTIEIPQEEMSSLLAHFSQEVYDAKVVFGRKGWCITVVVTIVSAAIAYFVSGRALKPLQQLAQQAQRVDQDSIATARPTKTPCGNWAAEPVGEPDAGWTGSPLNAAQARAMPPT